jgi:hypothetical protein
MADEYQRRGLAIELNLTNLVILVMLTLILVQVVGVLFPKSLSIHLGPIFILIVWAFCGAMSTAVFKKLMNDTPVTGGDTFAIAVTAALALFASFFLRDLLPEIFQQSLVSMMSVLGF